MDYPFQREIILHAIFICFSKCFSNPGWFEWTAGLYQVGTITRQMLVYAPSGIEQNRPLVIRMHGRGQTMYDQKNQTQFESVARDNNFVMVYPNTIDKSWQLWGTTDVDFILAIIDEMYNRYKILDDAEYREL